MATANIGIQCTIDGFQISGSENVEAEGSFSQDTTNAPLPAGKAGVITRSDADTGVATLSTGHGIVNSDKVAVFWDGGCRLEMTATVATNDVTVDGGHGDSLPATAATPVVVTKMVTINQVFATADLQALAARGSQRCAVDFQDDGDASVLLLDLAAAAAFLWMASLGANPVTDDVARIRAANGSSDSTLVLKIGGVLDTVA